MQVMISEINDETSDIKSLVLMSPYGTLLPRFTAGAHIDVVISESITRQYSLCNSSSECDRYVIGVKKDPDSRGGSSRIHESFKAKDIIEIGYPRNHFPVDENARSHVLFAGGIGVTPLLSMCYELLESDASFNLHYFARDEDSIAFKTAFYSPEFAGKIHFHLGKSPSETKAEIIEILQTESSVIGAHVYTCGPGPFMDLVIDQARELFPANAVHSERFKAGTLDGNTVDTEFEVHLARSNKTFLVPPGKSILDVMAAEGLPCSASCKEGVCGTCLTGVVEGIPEHRDFYLNDDEKQASDEMCICVSRAKTHRLVLDI